MKQTWVGSVLAVALVACGFTGRGSGDDPPDPPATVPTVVSSSPSDGAIDVVRSGAVTVTFSEAMDPATLTVASVTLASADGGGIAGDITYADAVVTFRPRVPLASDGLYTAAITTAATSDEGVALAETYAWSFTGEALFGAGGAPIALGTAGTYAVLATSMIVGTGATITGDLGLTPGVATAITGLGLAADTSNEFSTSMRVTGRVYAADYVAPTPAKLILALADARHAYDEAAGRIPNTLPLDATLDFATLAPGIYHRDGTLAIGTTITLVGSATDVWIFQLTGTLDLAASATIVLAEGALARNVFWQLPGAVTLGASAQFVGTVLTATAFTSGASTQITGRVLAQTAVTLTGSMLMSPP